MYTLPSRDVVLLYYVQIVWEWGGWCGISLIYPYLYLYYGPGALKYQLSDICGFSSSL